MTVSYGSSKFLIPAGDTWGFTTAFNGDTTNGGDYVGPMVAVCIPDGLQQEVTITPTSARFTSQDDGGLASRMVYDYSVTNNNGFDVNIRIDFFYN